MLADVAEERHDVQLGDPLVVVHEHGGKPPTLEVEEEVYLSLEALRPLLDDLLGIQRARARLPTRDPR